jgi:quinol monooxygenase YgiN
MAIRIIVQSNPSDAEARLPDLQKFTEATRGEPGCVLAEDFRSTDVPENLMHMELWESAEAWDAYWVRRAKSESGWQLLDLIGLDPAIHDGGIESPRTVGQNGVEVYDFAPAVFVDGAWQPDDGRPRPRSAEWPAWGGVRIIYQSTSHPDSDRPENAVHSMRRRGMAGCDQFERFRGIEFPENNVLMETWTPAAFDLQWEVLQQESTSGPPRPRPIPAERRYGYPGGEWYHHCFFVLVDGVWQPEDPRLRSIRVRW